MDFHLKQWKNQHHQSESHQAEIPKLFPADPSPQSAAVLPLFVSEPNGKINIMSASPDSTASAATRFPRTGSYFSLAQWQELELQALIFRYMLAGAAVPPELLQPIKRSVLHSHPYFLHYPQYQPVALLQSGYWERAAVDPEPGRCRRTDGKKWRCSRDAVAGHKYCERHMHRGRNRSRKSVESPAGGVGEILGAPKASLTASSLSAVPLKCPLGLLQHNPSYSGLTNTNKGPLQVHHGVNMESRPADGHILRHFFDDWPKSLQSPDDAESPASSFNSATCLSISMPGNPSSDVSLKLSTGSGEEEPYQVIEYANSQEQQLSWGGGWSSTTRPVSSSMGGPLAEALRSSTSNSPTSVLNPLPRGCASVASFISA